MKKVTLRVFGKNQADADKTAQSLKAGFEARAKGGPNAPGALTLGSTDKHHAFQLGLVDYTDLILELPDSVKTPDDTILCVLPVCETAPAP